MAKTPQTGNGAPANASASKERQQKSSATYIGLVDGNVKEFNFPNAVANTVKTTFANKVTRELRVDELPADIRRCAELQGFARRLQTAYQGEKDIDKCIEAYDETAADLTNGVWIAPKDGPRVMVVANALRRVLTAAGETVSDERFTSIVTKLKGEEHMEKALKNKAVLAMIETIKFENARARVQAANSAAKGESTTELAGSF